jgi:hypothetical protein
MIKLLLFILLFSNSAFADIVASTVDESYSGNVEVSATYLVGVQVATSTLNKSLHVFLPENTVGSICIDLSSIDGNYKAHLEYKINSPESGLTKIDFNSKYPDIMKNYAADEIAISARLNNSCEDLSEAHLIVGSWSENESGKLVILIRSDARKDVAYIPNQENYSNKAKCRKFRKPNNVTYDKYCTFENITLDKLQEIEIVSKNLQKIDPLKIFID